MQRRRLVAAYLAVLLVVAGALVWAIGTGQP
jgi:hypothetical protein